MIEPVLRRAPETRGPSHSTAAFLRTAKAEANLPDNRRSRLDPFTAGSSNSSRLRNHNTTDSRQQELYMQQVQDALRDASPDVRGDSSSAPQQAQKRPTSKMAPHRQRPVSPAQQAQQDLSERYQCITSFMYCTVNLQYLLLCQMTAS